MSENSFIVNKEVQDQIELIELAAQYKGELLTLRNQSDNPTEKAKFTRMMKDQDKCIRHYTKNILKYIKGLADGSNSKRVSTE